MRLLSSISKSLELATFFFLAIYVKLLDPDLAAAFDIQEEIMSEELSDCPALLRVANEALAHKVLHVGGPFLLDWRDFFVNDCA